MAATRASAEDCGGGGGCVAAGAASYEDGGGRVAAVRELRECDGVVGAFLPHERMNM